MKKFLYRSIVMSSLVLCSTTSMANYLALANNGQGAMPPPIITTYAAASTSSSHGIQPILPTLDESTLAILTFTPPAPWKIVNTTQKPGMRTTLYHKTGAANAHEALSEIRLDKEANRDANAIITGMSSHLKDLAVTDKCDVEPLQQIPQKGDKFQVWDQAFQCKETSSSVLQFYINADAKHLYLFTYTIPTYPLTTADRSSADGMLKSSIQICYKGQPCTPLS